MLIGLISDSHIPVTTSELPDEIVQAFHGVDLILHAGDIFVPAVLDQLQEIAPVLAARGDDDISPDPRIRVIQVLNIRSFKIGLIHDFFDILTFRDDFTGGLQQSMHRAFGGPVDIVVHGHSHVPRIIGEDTTLIINPGSALLPYYISRLGSVALLQIEDGQVEARIIELGQPGHVN